MATLPAPTPRSPPKYPDFHGRNRKQVELQILNREIGFLEEELRSIEGLQPASSCCKEVDDFVATNPDPLVPVNRKSRRSCSLWRWLRLKSCFNFSWLCCFSGCTCHLKCSCCSCDLERCYRCLCCPLRCCCCCCRRRSCPCHCHYRCPCSCCCNWNCNCNCNCSCPETFSCKHIICRPNLSCSRVCCCPWTCPQCTKVCQWPRCSWNCCLPCCLCF